MNKVLIIIIFCLIITLGLTSIVSNAPTFDETSYIFAGYSYLKTGEILLNKEHPPLSKIIMSAPLLLLNLKFEQNYSVSEDHIKFQSPFFMQNQNKIPLIFTISRIIIFLFNLLIILVVYFFSYSIFKNKTSAIISSALVVISPDFFAYSTLAINDSMFAFFYILSLYLLRNALYDNSIKNFIMLGISVAGAILTKFSGLTLLPIIGIIIVLKFNLINRRFLAGLIVSSVLLIITINLLYFKPLSGIQDYIEGVKLTGKYWRPGYKYFALGNFYEKNNPLYFFYALIFKSSEIHLLIWFSALSAFIYKLLIFASFNKKGSDNSGLSLEAAKDLIIFVLMPALAYFIIVSIKAPNIGYRYILPVNVAFCIFSGIIFLKLKNKFICILLPCILIFRLLLAGPDYISFFNYFCGGSEKGIYLLDDSNFDWGQDINKVRPIMNEKKIEKIVLLYFGTIPPEAYNINFIDFFSIPNEDLSLSPGWYTVSAHFINRLPAFSFNNTAYKFKIENALFKAGRTIYFFRLQDQ